MKITKKECIEHLNKALPDTRLNFDETEIFHKALSEVVKYLNGKYDIKEKPGMEFDCWVNPETGRAQSQRSMKQLQDLANDLGYILVPRFCSSVDYLERIIKDVRSCAESSDRLSGRIPHYAKLPRLPEDIYFKIPQYEKDQNFSETFCEALTKYFGDFDKNKRYVFFYTNGNQLIYKVNEVKRCYNSHSLFIAVNHKESKQMFSDLLVDCKELDSITEE